MFQSSFRRRAVALAASVAFVALSAGAALAADGYQTPPAPIAQILDSAPTPGVIVSPDRKVLAQLGRENLPTIAAVSEPILRLGGYRINPRNNGPIEARANWLNALAFEDVATGKVRPVALPAGARFFATNWSPDGSKLAFVMDAKAGLELWVADVKTATARKVTDAAVNATFGAGYDWLPDGSGLMVQTVIAGRGAPPAADATPTGPTIQESKGKVAAIRTYQDLLANAHDEALFDYYFASQLTRVGLDGKTVAVGAPGMISNVEISPDGQHLLISRLKRPYSYLVPAGLFPTEISVAAIDGKVEKVLVDRPLADTLPAAFDAVVTGPRSVSWRADAPAILVWAEAQDGGEPRKKVAVHDSVFTLAAPFSAAPTKLIDLDQRYRGVEWGRADFALVVTRWWQTRMEKRIAIDPSKPGAAGRVLVERNYQDRYNDPGDVLTRRDAHGEPLLHFTPDGKAVFVRGDGASAKGEYPFIGRMEVADGKNSRLWQAQAPYYELPIALADEAGKSVIPRRESAKDQPNYYVHALAKGAKPRALTAFPDRAPQFAGVAKQTITYKRADGVTLSGVLYLPAGYDKAKDGPLPLLMWAYPAEFTDAAVAGQTVDEGNRFTRPAGISHLFLLTQGYAVLDNPSFPIIGQNGAEPNDTYIQQLVADAQAAVDAVVALGVADRDKIAVGGHSYGAFMTANLLAHTRLFRAGIARSGAYNRTLTPFGFQAEQRTYWEATDTYTKMSPFTYATDIKDPILLIHGEADDNSGTFPIQSERFYAALKGAGATVRYVTLPNEPHGYRALESTKHTLWEMTQWMDKYVKNAPPRAAK